MPKLNQLRALVAASLVAGGTSVMAAVPDGAAAAITAYSTDTVTVIGLLIAAGIAVYAAKKLGAKMGWL
jgi:hypothetical protein